jgi:hypothetical protein
MLERHDLSGGAVASAPAAASSPVRLHVGHVATAFEDAPAGRGLLASATTDAGVALLHANFAAGDLSDLEAMQRHAAHVLHALDPGAGTDGPATGFGLARATEAVATHAALASEAPGASAAVRTHVGHMQQIARTVVGRSERAAAVARRLAEAPSIRDAAPLVAELRLLIYQIAEGGDVDGDAELALEGEAGLQQLEAHVYLLLEAEGLPRVIR